MPHIHEKIDFTVEVFIVHQNKVLLRMHDKFKKWLSVGGHIEIDEDPIEAAHREVKEEVGLDIELIGAPKLGIADGDLLAPVALNRHHASPTHEHVTLVYFARALTTDIKALHAADKSEECRWCAKEELEEMGLWLNVKTYALAALERLGKEGM